MNTRRSWYRVDFLFGLSGLLTLAAGSVFLPAIVYGSVYDTNFVLTRSPVVLVVATLFFLLAAIYFVFAKFGKLMNHLLGLSHFLLTVLPVLLLAYHFIDTIGQFPSSYYWFVSYKVLASDNLQVSWSVPPFVVGQLLLLVNVARTIFGSRQRP